MQRTFVIFKPDCMAQRHVGNVLHRFESAGFTIMGCKLARLTPALLREHYAHVASKPFYPEIEAFMSSSPVIMMALIFIGLLMTSTGMDRLVNKRLRVES